MSYTNGTVHYNLPQTVGTDKRDWSDTNQAFADVDAALYQASETASGAASDIQTIDAALNGSGGVIDRLTAAEGDIDTAEGSISTLQATVQQQGGDITDVRSDLQDAITAYNEPTATSTHAYAIGDYFFYNDILYKASAAIAVGATIVPNTNCVATNVSSELIQINSDLATKATLTDITSAMAWKNAGLDGTGDTSQDIVNIGIIPSANEVIVACGGTDNFIDIPIRSFDIPSSGIQSRRLGYYYDVQNYAYVDCSFDTARNVSIFNYLHVQGGVTSTAFDYHVYYR